MQIHFRSTSQEYKVSIWVVEDKGNARKFESSILWLYDADMIHISFQQKTIIATCDHTRYNILKFYKRCWFTYWSVRLCCSTRNY